MAITAKPYLRSEKIIRSIFGGRPKVMSEQDLNKEFDKIDDAILQTSKLVGFIRENWQVSVKLSKDSVSGGNNVFDSQISVVKVDNGNPAYVYFRGVRFEIPTGTAIEYTGSFSSAIPAIPVSYLFLVATLETANFSTEPTLCGINSSEFPEMLPSVDIKRYKNERLVYATSRNDVSLSGTEEIIGIIATIAPKDSSTLVPNTDDTAYTFTKSFTRVVLYNAVLMSELMSMYGVRIGDNSLTETPYSDGIGSIQSVLSNESLIDVILWLNEYNTRKQAYQTLINQHHKKQFEIFGGQLTSIITTVAGIAQNIQDILARPDLPLGAIIPYYGSLSDFETSGLGKVDTNMKWYAICNGKNATPDLRGRFLVGAIAGVPSVGAPDLSDEVDPNNPSLPGNTNPNYAVGDTGGESKHRLTIPELPENEIDLPNSSTEGQSDNADSRDVMIPATQQTINVGGEGAYHENKPPYFAVVYLMRIK